MQGSAKSRDKSNKPQVRKIVAVMKQTSVPHPSPLFSVARVGSHPREITLPVGPWPSHDDQAFAVAAGDGLGAGGGAELGEDGTDVELYGVFGDVQAGGDFFVGEA